MNLHHLNGCAPAPLAHYLKALGILRLVAEQLDPEARAYWEGERFVLLSRATEDELVQFFVDHYEPTPMFNPWGARSGFYPGSSERTSRDVLQRIEESQLPRFQTFQTAIKTTRDVLFMTTGGKKPDDTDKDSKLRLVRTLRAAFRGRGSAWLDAVIAVVDTDKGLEHPALFGTGGSEGSGSYTAAFMKALAACLLDREWDHGVHGVLLGAEPGLSTAWGESFGQFVPNGAASPWDLILAFEGACIIRSSVVKRSESDAGRWTSSPFVVSPLASGFSSGARIDEYALNKGKELSGRGEQWFPLWSTAATALEVARLFQEGRAIAGPQRRCATTQSLAAAVARVGTARGIREFARFGYLQRNNQATHFAVPLGRFVVPEHAAASLACLDDLARWLPRLHRRAHDKNAPARLMLVERRVADAVLAVVEHPDSPEYWQTLLLALAGVEAIQITGSGHGAGPIPRLRPEWINVGDDGSSEFRLAVSCALQSGSLDKRDNPIPDDGPRRHWVTLKNGRYRTTGTGGQERLQPGSDRVLQGRHGIDDAIVLVTRRLIEGSQSGTRHIPLYGARGAFAAEADLAHILEGQVDLDRTMALARALMAVRPSDWARRPVRLGKRPDQASPDAAWLVVRMATFPLPLRDRPKISLDPAIVRRLESGDANTSVELALRKLQAAGIHPAIRFGTASPRISRLWAAALAFPICPNTAEDFLRRLDPRSSKETAA